MQPRVCETQQMQVVPQRSTDTRSDFCILDSSQMVIALIHWGQVFRYCSHTRSDNKVREFATVCLPWQHWRKAWIVNQVYYLEVLKRLREKVRRKRPELSANNSWILHHDNAPAHTVLSVREFLATKQITVLEHPAYSPDLAPSDYFCFRR